MKHTLRSTHKQWPQISILTLMVVIMMLGSSKVGWGQLTENFETGLPTSYTTETSYDLGSGTWTGQVNGVIRGTTGSNSGSYSCQLRSQTGAQITTPTLTGGVGTISFYVSASAASGGLQIRISTDGGENWTQVSGSPISFGTTIEYKTFEVNDPNVNKVQFYRTAATVYLDDVEITTASLSIDDYFVNFEGSGETKTGYSSETVILSGLDWDMTQALIGTDGSDMKNGLRSARIRYDGTTYGSISMLEDKPNGIGVISFLYTRSNFSGDRTGTAPVFVVEYSINSGDSWSQAGTQTNLDGINELTEFSVTVNVVGNSRIRIRQVAGASGKRWNIDDILITDYEDADPIITTLTGTADWSSPGNWSDGIPDENTNAVIDGDVTITTAVEVSNLSINTGKSVTVSSSGSLTVHGNLDNEGSILIESNATGTGSLIHNTTGQNATVEYYMSASAGDWTAPATKSTTDWRYVAPPVSGQNVSAFLTGTGNFDLAYWDEESDLWRYYNGGSFAHTDFQLGTGYLTAFENLENLVFEGSLHGDDYTFSSLSNKGSGYTTVLDTDPDYYLPGWNLVGNPYSSAIQFIDSGDDAWTGSNVNITPVYWTSGGTYDAYNPNDIIPISTAFFIHATTDAGALTIPKGTRVHQNTAAKNIKNDNGYHRLALLAKPKDGKTWQRSVIRLEPDANSEYDNRYHVSYMTGNAPMFYSYTNNERWLVNVVNQINPSLTIPFVFRKNHEGNEFQISLHETIPGTTPYLYDRKLGVEHALSFDNPYLFTAEDADNPLRFELRFAELGTEPTSIPETETPTARIFANQQTLTIEQYDITGERTLEIFDLSGRILIQQLLDASPKYQQQINLNPGVYMVRLSNNQSVQTEKIIITH